MPLFQCSKCHCVENTALGRYWSRARQVKLCSECATGEWHNRFPKQPATGMLIDDAGFLWSDLDVRTGYLPNQRRIVGCLKADGTAQPLDLKETS